MDPYRAEPSANPAVNNTGFLSIFPVEQQGGAAACLSNKDVRSSPDGTAVLFGSSTIPNSNNLFVTDGACFVTNADKNPTLTIMALTWRACDYLLGEAKKGNLGA